METPHPSQQAETSNLIACPTCDLPTSSKYCPECGEQLDRPLNRTLRDFFFQSLGSLFQIADTKLMRSLANLIKRPGALTAAYMEGSRVPYMHPFRVFLVANILFFLVASTTGQSPVTTKLWSHMHSENFYHQAVAKRMVDAYIAEAGIEFEVYAAAFDERVDTFAKSLVIVMLPVFAGLLGLLMAGRGESGVKHLAFSCHTYAHLLLCNFILVLGILGFLFLATPLQGLSSGIKEFMLSASSMAILLAFLYFGIRRAYKTGQWLSIALCIVSAMGVYFILLVYRALLFFVTFYSLSF